MASESGSQPAAQLLWSRVANVVYAASLGVSICVWFLAIRAPLRTDEAGSYWQISAGLWHIWSRQTLALALPAYYYILWFSTQLLGTSELALRIPSAIAMLLAAYVFYLVARELFEREVAVIGTVIFCLNPITVFEAMDVRAYAFAVLLTNVSLLLLLRLRRRDCVWLAASFGLALAGMLYFQILFAVLVPALIVWFVYFKVSSGKETWQQAAAAFAAFAVALVPLVPIAWFVFHTARSHVFAGSAPLMDLVVTLAPGGLVAVVIALVTLAALAANPTDRKSVYPRWKILFCASVALVPTLLLFGTDNLTPIHVFVPRYCFVAVPGIALCWAMLFGGFRARLVRAAFCAAITVLWILYYTADPTSYDHGGSWKYALQAAESNASRDNAPVLICSPFPESNYTAMSGVDAKDSFFFAPLSYYRLSVPAVPLPRSLNAEAIRVGSTFLKKAESSHARFLAMGTPASYRTLHWLAQRAAGTYNVRTLGVYDRIQVKVVEFQPR